MPLYTGSVNTSWISTNQNREFVVGALPVTTSYVYQAPRSSSIVAQLGGTTNTVALYRLLPIMPYTTASTQPALNVDRLVIYQTNNIMFGLVDTQFVEFQPPVLILDLSTVYLKYAWNKAPSPRRGLFIQKTSGSPHISMEPTTPSASWLLSGDVWMLETGSTNRGLYMADYSNNMVPSSESIVPFKIIASSIPDTFDGGTF